MFRAAIRFAFAATAVCWLASALSAAEIRTDKSSYLVLEPIVVTYSALPGNSTDWITVVPAASSDNTAGPYQFTGGRTSGTMTFSPPDQPGTYEARLYFNNEYTVRARVRFTISYPVPTVSTAKTAYLVLEPIVVNYSNLPGYSNDYITLVRRSSPDNVYGPYQFTSGKKSGTMTFDPQEPGEWEARVHFRNDDSRVYARSFFSVAYPNTTITTDRTVYGIGDRIVVSYADMPGYPNDYITLVRRSSPDNVYGAYQFTGGKKSGTMTFDPHPAGEWEARVHYRNDDSRVYARTFFTVSTSSISVTVSPASVAQGGTVTVSWSGGRAGTSDYVGLFRLGDTVNSGNLQRPTWAYTRTASGSQQFTIPQAPGQYVFHYLLDDGYQVAATSNTFTVTAPGQSLELSTRGLDFGRVTVGQSADRTLTLRNTGTTAQTISSAPSTNLRFALASPAVPFTLAAGETRTLTVRFTPTAAGEQTGSLTLGNQTVSLTGIGEAATGGITLSVSPASIAQGGAVTVSWNAPGRTGRTTDWVGFFRVGEAVMSGNLLRPTWEYTGGTVTGSKSITINWGPGQYVFYYLFDDGYEIGATSNTLTVTAAGGTLQLTPSALDFGGVFTGQTKDLTLTLTNLTSTAQTINAVTVTNPVFRLVSPAPPFTVAGNASQLLTVRFAPVITGTQSATLTVQSLTASLTGRGDAGSGGGSGGNLITGGGGEDPGRITACQVLGERFGWLGIGGFAICPYGVWVPAEAPGPPDRGLNHFWGGSGTAISNATQSIDLTRSATAIDAGTQPFTLSGWLGGWEGQDDNAIVRVSFFSGSGGMVGDTVTIGPVLAAERRSLTGMLYKSATGLIPVGARRADVTIVMTRVSGSDNDAFADNVAFTLTAEAPPVSSIELTPRTLDFGRVTIGQPAYRDLTVRNTGTLGQTLSSLALSGGFALTSPRLPVTLPAGSTQILTFVFNPGEAGDRTLTLNILGQTAVLTGTGISGGGTTSAELTPRALDFGTVLAGQTSDLTLTLRNTGTTAQTVSRVDITNARFTLASPALPFDLAAGATRTLTVRFAPTAAGSQTGTLTVLGLTATLSGTGAINGGGGGGTCGYFVNPLSSQIPAGGGTSLILVQTAPGCAWTATATAAWIEITAGTSGTGAGAVSLRIGPNLTTSPRTGTVTIGSASQRVTHTVTQEAGPSCTYSLDRTTDSAPGSGGTLTVRVSTQGGCPIPVTPSVAWIRASVSGATVTLTIEANPNAQPRTGAVSIAGLTFTVVQAAAGSTGGPSIATGGVVGAASFTPASLPGGALARGSFFSIFGLNIGPASPVQATSYPLAATLGDVVVAVTQGGRRVEAYPYFVMDKQINAILPSNTPLGDVQMTVTYRGVTSAPMPVRVVDTNFGIFSTQAGRGPGIIQNAVAQGQTPLNTRSFAARPGQYAILWGTGLGPINTPDYTAPPAGEPSVPVEIVVGGKAAVKTYSGRAPGLAGLDQIVFILPEDVPLGCNVPVQIKAAGLWSNTVTMAISRDGSPCSDAGSPFQQLQAGTRGASIFLTRAEMYVTEEGKAPAEWTIDFGLGMFQETTAVGEIGFNLVTSLPPLGTCTAFTGALDDGGLLGAGTSLIPGKELDAGRELRITSPSGVMKTLVHAEEEEGTGPYAGLLGGGLPDSSKPPEPLFLTGGTYTVSGTGGRDAGAFTTTATMPASRLAWTNRNTLTTISRSEGFRLTWTGGAGQSLIVVGLGSDAATKATSGFYCLLPTAPGSFDVPPSALANLPAVSGNAGAALMLLAYPSELPAPFPVPGLDTARVIFGSINGRTVGVR